MGTGVTAEPKTKSRAEVSAEHTEPVPSAFDLDALYGAPAGMPLFLKVGLQRKLAVGAVDDPFEREADQVADQVMRSADNGTGSTASRISDDHRRTEAGVFAPPLSLGNHARADLGVADSAIQRKCACGGSSSGECEECRKREEERPGAPVIQRRTSNNDSHSAGATDAPPIVHQALRSPGQPLDASVRPLMESRFGRDFSDVRVHTDPLATKSAQAINALAYTSGKDVVFAQGQYSPYSSKGKRLLAHELTHVAQQSHGAVNLASASDSVAIGEPSSALEQEADQSASAFMSGNPAATASHRGPPLQRESTHSGPVMLVQRQKDDDKEAAADFITANRFAVATALEADLRTAVVPINSPYASWVPGKETDFMMAVLASPTQSAFMPALVGDLWSALLEALAPVSADALTEAVDRGRGRTTEKTAPPAAVARELSALYLERIAASVARMMPRYLMARNQALLAAEAKAAGPQSIWVEPDPADVPVSYPIDRSVLQGLLAGTVDFNQTVYRDRNPSERTAHEIHRVKQVQFDWMFKQALWTWITLKDTDATAEDVAFTLYGDEAKAYLIVPAAPMFGFAPRLLIDPWRRQWLDQAGAADTPESIGIPVGTSAKGLAMFGMIPDLDPHQEASQSILHDQIVLNQAKAFAPTGANRLEILQQMSTTLHLLENMMNPPGYNFLAELAPAYYPLLHRAERLKQSADDKETTLWSAHTAAQADVVRQAAAGFSFANQQIQARQGPKGGHVEMEEYTRKPLERLMSAYVAAAGASEYIDDAQPKLQHAYHLASTLRIEILEGMLDYVRAELAKSQPQGASAALGAEAEEYTQELARAREVLQRDPSQAEEIVAHMQEHITNLKLRAVVGSTLGMMSDAVKELKEHILHLALAHHGTEEDFAPFQNAAAGLEPFFKDWNQLYVAAWMNDSKALEAAFKKVQSSQEGLQKALNEVAKRVQDAREHRAIEEQWERILMVVALAVGTMGVGELLVGVAEGLELGAGGSFLLVTTGEAVFYTTASLALEGNLNWKTFATNLVLNWATFGVMRGTMSLYRAALGSAAKTVAAQIGEFTATVITQTATSVAAADVKSRIEKGRGLTADEAWSIAKESLVTGVAFAVGMRVAEPLLPNFKAPGKALGKKLVEINGRRAKLRGVAASIHDNPKGVEPAQELVADDAALVKDENELLSKLNESIKDLPQEEKSQVEDALKANRASAKDLEDTKIMLELESVGPNEYLCEQGKLDEVTSHLESKEPGPRVRGPNSDSITGARYVDVYVEGEPPYRITEKVTPGAEPVATKPLEPAKPGEPQPAQKFKTMDDILTQDGFQDPELEAAYQKYKKKKGDNAVGREEWARRVTSGTPRKLLEEQLGPDYARQGGTSRQINLSDVPRPQTYTPEQEARDLATLQAHRSKVFERLGKLQQSGVQNGQVNAGHFNICKGNVGEVLSFGKQADVLMKVRQQFPEAELITGVRVRVMDPSTGRLSELKLFSDNLIGTFDGPDLDIHGKFEVKSGPRGGAEATSQFFDWVEGRLTEGSVLEVPGRGSFVWGAKGIQRVTGLANAQSYIIAPEGAEQLGLGSAEQTVKVHERIGLEQTASQIDYLTRLMLESLATPTPTAAAASTAGPGSTPTPLP